MPVQDTSKGPDKEGRRNGGTMEEEVNGTHTKVYAIDIETVSQGKRANDYTDQRSYKIGNVKDPIKVEAKLREKREEARSKHALTWYTGKIISIAIVDVYGGDESIILSGHDEHVILTDLAKVLNKPCKMIGKTSKTFDFPFMVGRFMANGITLPAVFKHRFNLLDTDDFFGFSSASSQRGRLDDYAHGIGYKGKPMHGNAVAGLYASIVAAETVKKDPVAAAAGWKQLKDYNLHDSMVVKEMTLAYYGRDRAGI